MMMTAEGEGKHEGREVHYYLHVGIALALLFLGTLIKLLTYGSPMSKALSQDSFGY